MDRHTKAWVSPRDYADMVGVSESTVKRWCDASLVDSVRTSGGHRRIMVTVHRQHSSRSVGRPHFLRNSQPQSPNDVAQECFDRHSLKEAMLLGNVEKAWAAVVTNLAKTSDATLLIDHCLRAAINEIEKDLVGQFEAVYLWELAFSTYSTLLQRLVRIIYRVNQKQVPAPSVYGACQADIAPSLYEAIAAGCTILAHPTDAPPSHLSIAHWLAECQIRKPKKAWIALSQRTIADKTYNDIDAKEWNKVSDVVKIVLLADPISDHLVCTLPHAFHTTHVGELLEYIYGPSIINPDLSDATRQPG